MKDFKFKLKNISIKIIKMKKSYCNNNILKVKKKCIIKIKKNKNYRRLI